LKAVEGERAEAAEEAAAGAQLIAELEATLASRVGRCRTKGLQNRIDSAWCQRLKLAYDDTGFKPCFLI
jgi:hypothetical protein